MGGDNKNALLNSIQETFNVWIWQLQWTHTVISYFLRSSNFLLACYIVRSYNLHWLIVICPLCVFILNPSSFHYPFCYIGCISHNSLMISVILPLYSYLKFSFLSLESDFFMSKVSYVASIHMLVLTLLCSCKFFI